MTLLDTVARPLTLEVAGGVLRVPRQRRKLVVTQEPSTVGRHPSCHLVLDDPRVSAVHAELVATADGVRLRDLGSRNGVILGGARIREALLVSPCKLLLGDTELAFEPSAPERVRLQREASFGGLVAASASMRSLFQRAERAAATELTVLIGGETGTGKELLAKALHDASPRRPGPFVVVDCGAIAPSLAEAILFGHEKGAFTGASARRLSPFVEAQGGTIFLDELGELPIELQPKLLRLLEERRVKAVGGRAYEPVDVRVVAATRRDLQRSVNDGSFRSDLYFRLAQLRLELPPLRERPEDIPVIVRKLLADAGDEEAFESIAAETFERLMRHDWPGNARELRNAVVAARSLAEAGRLDILAFVASSTTSTAPAALDPPAEGLAGYHEAKRAALERFERGYFRALYQAAGGKIVEMARLGGLERAHVRKYLRRHGIG